MSDERGPTDDYRWARQVSALLLIAVVVVIVVPDIITLARWTPGHHERIVTGESRTLGQMKRLHARPSA